MAEFTHLNKEGLARMVDVSDKECTIRKAVASGRIYMNPTTILKIKTNDMKKGNVLSVSQVAGIMAMKKTASLIPMCHHVDIKGCDITFIIHDDYIECIAYANCLEQTGIEMEVITGVSIALVTLYDMCKSVDKEMVICDIKLVEKIGGKSGHYKRGE